MISRILPLAITVGLMATACHTTKKAKATESIANEPGIQLDTVSVTANEPVKKEIYRGSNPRSNDIIHTRLDVNFDWKQSRMNGKATIQLKPYFYPVSMLYLDARGMDIKTIEVFEVTSVTDKKKVNGKLTDDVVDIWNRVMASSYKYENDSLKISLGKTFTHKDTYYVVIDYVAKPDELKAVGGSNAISSDKGLYFINPNGDNPYKMPQIWTQGETQANSVWFPTIDSPNEKMTQDIYMTVDDKYTTLSNGLLVDSQKDAAGKRVDHWKMDQPHSTYLAMMAVGEFKKVTDQPWNGKEISYYVEKEYEQHAVAIFGDTKEMIEFYSTRLGVPYAWPKYAQIAVRDYVSGAMENTSATLHGDFVVYQTTRETIDGKKGEDVICHELFHQWFGDLATAESWSNLPLNESFATYGEYLWNEYKFGRDAADHHSWQSRQGYMSSPKEVNLIRFNYDDKEDMFDVFSYNKGGQVLHMLRKAVGDDAFFASLKNYLETKKYQSAEIHDLRLAFEETTGQDMNWFFNQWFLNKGRPELKVTQKYNAASSAVELTVEQNQDLKKSPLYTLPLEIDVYTNGKAQRSHITITDVKQTFTIATTGAPQLVNFDAERQLLCSLDYLKTKEEYIFQYKNAPLYGDRMEALRELGPKQEDGDVFALYKNAAQNDKFSQVRNYAMGKLEKASDAKLPEVKTVLVNVYNTDKKTRTRAKALEILNNKFPNDADVAALDEKALSEQSYAICGAALDGLSKINPKLALEKAKLFEKENGKDVLFPVANLYGNNGGDDQIAFFHNSISYFNGFELMTFSNAYSKTAKRCVNAQSAVTAAADLEMLSKGANKYVKFSTQKAIKDILGVWETKETTAKAALATAKKENKNTADPEKELKTITDAKEAIAKSYEHSKASN